MRCMCGMASRKIAAHTVIYGVCVRARFWPTLLPYPEVRSTAVVCLPIPPPCCLQPILLPATHPTLLACAGCSTWHGPAHPAHGVCREPCWWVALYKWFTKGSQRGYPAATYVGLIGIAGSASVVQWPCASICFVLP